MVPLNETLTVALTDAHVVALGEPVVDGERDAVRDVDAQPLAELVGDDCAVMLTLALVEGEAVEDQLSSAERVGESVALCETVIDGESDADTDIDAQPLTELEKENRGVTLVLALNDADVDDVELTDVDRVGE